MCKLLPTLITVLLPVALGATYENEQVFLSDTDGRWTFLDAGTGIACSGTDISAPLLTACEALGLR
jgi:hypothetical protein